MPADDEVVEELAPAAPATRGLTLGAGIGTVFVLVGAVIGMGRLSDNSFFTHLATGRIILDERSIPTVDPYTFHALGDPWTVQSWLVSLIYAGTDELVGLAGPRLVHMALAAAVAAVFWWTTRHVETLIPRVLVTSVGIAAGAWMWVERPLMVGLLCFGLILVLADRGSVWWAVPVMWIWVNSHGSFPFALLLVATIVAGRRLDRAPIDRLLHLGAAVAIGTLVGGLVTPLPGRLLVFPFTVLGRTDQFQAVSEWRSPDFSSLGPRLFLLQLVLVLLAAPRVRQWSVVVPGVVFAAAALVGVRNVPMAALVLTPWLAAAAPSFGSLRAEVRSRLGTALAAVAMAGILVVLLSLVGADHLDPWGYPIAEIVALEGEGTLPSGARVAYEDQVGNYLEYRYGPTGDVFFDDRFDFYSEETLATMIDLHNGRDVVQTLDDFEIEIVIWETESSVTDALRLSDAWVEDPPLAPLPGDPAEADGTTGWSIFRRS